MLTKIWNNRNIRIRQEDRYVCLSDIAKASGKRLSNWKQNDDSKEYLKALEQATGIPAFKLVEAGKGKPTFAHSKVALRFAQWCSPHLAVQVDFWLDELLTTGSVSIAPKPEPLPELNPVELINAADKLEDINNATLQELLRNELIDYLSVKQGNKALPSAKKEYTICKVRARELGYSTKDIGNGSALGVFVAKHLKCAFSERIGKYDVKHYEVTDELDTVIHDYFGLKKALS